MSYKWVHLSMAQQNVETKSNSAAETSDTLTVAQPCCKTTEVLFYAKHYIMLINKKAVIGIVLITHKTYIFSLVIFVVPVHLLFQVHCCAEWSSTLQFQCLHVTKIQAM